MKNNYKKEGNKMNDMNNDNNTFRYEPQNKKGNTLSALFALIGFIALSAGLMMYTVLIIYIGIDTYSINELYPWYYGSLIFIFIALSLNIVSMVLSTMEFNKNIISRDRVFFHIAILTFNFFMLLTYLF